MTDRRALELSATCWAAVTAVVAGDEAGADLVLDQLDADDTRLALRATVAAIASFCRSRTDAEALVLLLRAHLADLAQKDA